MHAAFLKSSMSLLLVSWLLALGLPPNAVAVAGKAKFNKVLDPGDQAPDWSDLPGVDGKKHSLDDFRDAPAVVLFFTCNRCPVSKQYAERVAAFCKKYGDKVPVVAISVSLHGADRLPQMVVRTAEKPVPYPYLHDESQFTGRTYGAVATPQFFVLDRERRVAYMGAFDDQPADPAKVEKHYVIDAVEAVLAGKEPAVRESLPRGCAIDYE